MQVSNSSSFTGANWEPYSTAKSWALAACTSNQTVYARFRDAASNISGSFSDSIDCSSDTTPPSVSVSCPSGYTTSITASTSYTVNDSESAVTSKSLQQQSGSLIEGVCGEAGWSSWSTINSGSGNGTVSYNAPVSGSTCYQWHTQATSSGGTATSSTCGPGPLKVDNQAPTTPGAPVCSPAPWNNGNYTCSWAASYDAHSGIAGYDVYEWNAELVNWGYWTSLTGSSFNISNKSENSYKYKVYARDNAGNISAPSPDSNTVNVDRTAPAISAQASGSKGYMLLSLYNSLPGDFKPYFTKNLSSTARYDSVTKANDPVFVAKVTDSSGLKSTKCSIEKDGLPSSWFVDDAICVKSYDYQHNNAVYSMTIVATDNAGNTITLQGPSATVSNQSPLIFP